MCLSSSNPNRWTRSWFLRSSRLSNVCSYYTSASSLLRHSAVTHLRQSRVKKSSLISRMPSRPRLSRKTCGIGSRRLAVLLTSWRHLIWNARDQSTWLTRSWSKVSTEESWMSTSSSRMWMEKTILSIQTTTPTYMSNLSTVSRVKKYRTSRLLPWLKAQITRTRHLEKAKQDLIYKTWCWDSFWKRTHLTLPKINLPDLKDTILKERKA